MFRRAGTSMDSKDTKRQRGENFTPQDKELLLERIIEKKDIVEMKKSDAVSAKAKEQAWIDIANNYNALTSFPRTPVALKMCWENMKRKCRKAFADMNANKAGGNKRPCIIENDPLLYRVKDILNLSSDNHNNNAYDSAALYNDSSNSKIMPGGIKEEHTSDTGDRSVSLYGYASSNWSDGSSYRAKRPSVDAHRPEKRLASKTSPYIQSLTSETSESETHDMEEIHFADTWVAETNNYSPKASYSKRVESSKTTPCVQRLTFETTSDGETPREDDQIVKANNSRNNARWQSRRRPHQTNSLSDLLTESKIELVKIAKEHAITEERRRSELHDLQVEETRLKIVEEKKRIALYELRAQETELKIEVLKSKLENGIFD